MQVPNWMCVAGFTSIQHLHMYHHGKQTCLCHQYTIRCSLKPGIHFSTNEVTLYWTAPMWCYCKYVCMRQLCKIRGCCFMQNWAMLTSMDWQPLDQAVQCISMFAEYASGCLRCLQQYAEAIRCSAVPFVFKCILSIIHVLVFKNVAPNEIHDDTRNY